MYFYMDDTWVMVEPIIPIISSHYEMPHNTIHSLQPYLTPIGITYGLLHGMMIHMGENKILRALYMEHSLHVS